jgi:hypothetical protein
MISWRLSRRNFLWSVGAASGFHALLRSVEAAAVGATPPQRFMVIYHPIGGNHDHWVCKGTETDFELSMILEPFAPVKANMVAIDGMRIVKQARPGTAGSGCHEGNTVCLMTGEPHDGVWPGNGGDDAKVGAPSVDQLFLQKSPATLGAPAGKIGSLQVGCDERTDSREYSCRRLSASGPGVPLDPYYSPAALYDAVFGNFMPNASPQTQVELANARAARKSVLDFSLRDMARLKTLAGTSERPRLEAHETLIRELEMKLDNAPNGGDLVSGCIPGTRPTDPPNLSKYLDTNHSVTPTAGGDQDVHKLVAELHFATLRVALSCDMTRVITFQYAPGTSHVNFQGFYPGDPTAVKLHHTQSHQSSDPNTIPFMANVSRWYSQITADFLVGLQQTLDTDGTPVLDNMIIPYVTEARWDHRSDNAFPVCVFGGTQAGLRGGRYKTYGSGSTRPMNDMWLACAQMLGVPVTTLGTAEMYTQPLDLGV